MFELLNSSTVRGNLIVSGNISANNLSGSLGTRQIGVYSFTTSQTYTPSPSMSYCTVYCCGAGGQGGNINGISGTSQVAAGGGGGGGGTGVKTYSSAQIGSNATIVIGSAAGGGAGGQSSFTPSGGGSTLIGYGGQPGSGGSGGTIQIGGGNIGGNYSGADWGIQGGDGVTGFGVGNLCVGGVGGSSFFSGNRIGNLHYGTDGGGGNNAISYGQGGSGAAATTNSTFAGQTGGLGYQGIVIVTEFI